MTFKVVCLCPTYGRPARLLNNALACFMAQDYDPAYRKLVFLSDDGRLESHGGDNWHAYGTSNRFPTLASKYYRLCAMTPDADAYCVWDDDDIYLPHHISASVQAMQDNDWSKPSRVLSLYTGRVEEEDASGRFHGSIGVTQSLVRRTGGWVQTKRVDYDQLTIAAFQRAAEPGDLCRFAKPSYIFRWGSTGTPHCSGISTGPTDMDWYDKYLPSDTSPIGRLEPVFDDETDRIINGR